jgi:hypothetical protein
MDDHEFDEACNFLLAGVRDLYPDISKNLTKTLNAPKYKPLSKTERKVAKIRLLHHQHPEVISHIYAKENAAWARESRSDISNFFYKLERRADSLNAYGELTGGNFTAKV